MLRTLPALVLVVLVTTGVAIAEHVSIEMVTVGNPGNDPDGTGYGRVDYAYNIGKYEVTAGQYTAFLNAVAKTDAYGLYNGHVWSHNYGCKIQRSGTAGNYTYSVASDYADRPANYLSWGDAARFMNWLHNGQPTGAQDASTTEDGAYDLSGTHPYYNPDGGYNDYDALNAALIAVTRKAGARYWIPTENEWYKAAYYDPTLNDGDGGYWDYPTMSNSQPGRDISEITNPGNNANWSGWNRLSGPSSDRPDPFPLDSPYYTTVRGEFELSASYYGTFDQGGNVWEWDEAVIDDDYRGFRGGSFAAYPIALFAESRPLRLPTDGISDIGIRVASAVPAPSAPVGLISMGIMAALVWRRRWRAA